MAEQKESINEMNSTQFSDAIQRHDMKIIRIQEEQKHLYDLRNQFKKLFPIVSISSLNLNQFVYGRKKIDETDSFCYWLENKLSLLGRIGGSPATQYGVYYGSLGESKEKEYRFTAKYGSNLEIAFREIKNEIFKLLKAGEENDFNAISNSKIADKFKGKLLSTYFPNKYLNIFDHDYLKQIITHFNLDTTDINSKEPVFQQLHLLEFKNRDSIMSAWSVDEFAVFLNNEWLENYGGITPEILVDDDSSSVIFPSLDEVNPEFIAKIDVQDLPELKGKQKTKGKFNPNKRQKVLKQYGNRGEQIVLKAERQWILKNKLSVNQLIHTANFDDTAGYDIESINLDGSKKFIEVKATTRKAEYIEFYLSAAELKFAKESTSYVIYIVFEVHTLDPKIYVLLNPFNPVNEFAILSPVNYIVNVNLHN